MLATRARSGGNVNRRIFTSGGTFTVPAGYSAIRVTAIGAGGQGGFGSGSPDFFQGGGGAGGGAVLATLAVTAGQTVSVAFTDGDAIVTYTPSSSVLTAFNGGAGETATTGPGANGTGGGYSLTGSWVLVGAEGGVDGPSTPTTLAGLSGGAGGVGGFSTTDAGDGSPGIVRIEWGYA